MEKDTVILTRKIQLFIDCDDKEKRSEYYKTLFEWQDMTFRGANLVLSHQFVQENIKELLYLQEDIKWKLADRKVAEDGILTTSRMNSTYRVLSSYFKGKMNTEILTCLNTVMIKAFNTDRLAYWKGEKSLRNYKKTIPIPFKGTTLKLKQVPDSQEFSFMLFKVPFRTYLGRDRSDKRVLLQRIVTGQIKICTSSIQIVKGKIFLLATLELPKKQHKLKDHVIAEASLSIEHPIVVQIGKQHYQIGHKEEFLHRRLAIQSARHRLQRAVAFNTGGHGRKKKLQALERFDQQEKNYIDSRLHLYSKRLIEACIKSQAGTLLLVNQSNKEEVAKEDEFLLRNWSYFGLIEKIKYKAEMSGINLLIE